MSNKYQYVVFRDTREKNGWNFQSSSKCLGMEDKALKTGDYTISGAEDLICIERKASPSEISTNLIKERKTFDKELERMREFTYAYIVCEFSMADLLDYPFNDDLPEKVRKKIKVRGKYLMKLLLQIELKYPNIRVVFAGNAEDALYYTSALFYELNANDLRKV